jgi:hypothetical protein
VSGFDPDITPLHGTPSVEEQARGQPAQDRPHPHAPEPQAIDPRWWDRLYREIDIESLLSSAMACHRARRYWEQPGWPEIYQRLQLVRAELWDAMDQYPDSHLLRELYRQVLFVMRGRA